MACLASLTTSLAASLTTSLALLMSISLTSVASANDNNPWQPKEAPLMTRWAKDVSPENVHAEYPRPQMVREDWTNLNGLWDYAVVAKSQAEGTFEPQGRILVPFPIESALSGVMRRVSPEEQLIYRRSFEAGDLGDGRRLLLHFGAVDWQTRVFVNGTLVGEHTGGYDPFTFDITGAVRAGEANELVVAVTDPTDSHTQPRGKQVREPHSIYYVPTTGIWQTVWLETVPAAHLAGLKLVPDVENHRLIATATGSEAATGGKVTFTATDPESGRTCSATGTVGETVEIEINEPKLWSPDRPFLYDLRVTLTDEGGEAVDAVESYFGMRKISLGKDEAGITRILLNDEFVFQYGPLDQGFWPDGLYTAPTDEALRYDLEVTKQLGFNMSRKHVKVEPARWYYWADKLGVLVWQDMPSGDRGIGRKGPELEKDPEDAKQFELEYRRMIDALHNHPSIIIWVPFNEGWGQYDTVRITEWMQQYDPSRLVNNASGWIDKGVGDMHDFHAYPGPASPDPEENRAAVLGEFGGLGLPVAGHLWQDQKNWGYRTYETSEALRDAYLDLMGKLAPMINAPGLSAAVYTQLTDVEIEVNGLLTYDREVIKLDPQELADRHRSLIERRQSE